MAQAFIAQQTTDPSVVEEFSRLDKQLTLEELLDSINEVIGIGSEWRSLYVFLGFSQLSIDMFTLTFGPKNIWSIHESAINSWHEIALTEDSFHPRVILAYAMAATGLDRCAHKLMGERSEFLIPELTPALAQRFGDRKLLSSLVNTAFRKKADAGMLVRSTYGDPKKRSSTGDCDYGSGSSSKKSRTEDLKELVDKVDSLTKGMLFQMNRINEQLVCLPRLKKVIFLTGPPLVGKSTLCAGLYEGSFRIVSAKMIVENLATRGDEGARKALEEGGMGDPVKVTKELGKCISMGREGTVVIDGFPLVQLNYDVWRDHVEGQNGIRWVGTIVLKAGSRRKCDDNNQARWDQWERVTEPLIESMKSRPITYINDAEEFKVAANIMLI